MEIWLCWILKENLCYAQNMVNRLSVGTYGPLLLRTTLNEAMV